MNVFRPGEEVEDRLTLPDLKKTPIDPLSPLDLVRAKAKAEGVSEGQRAVLMAVKTELVRLSDYIRRCEMGVAAIPQGGYPKPSLLVAELAEYYARKLIR